MLLSWLITEDLYISKGDTCFPKGPEICLSNAFYVDEYMDYMMDRN